MDNGIGVGILVALTFTSTIFILQSNYFTKSQKIILGILFIFPPAQWILGIIIGFGNKYKDSTIGFKIDSAKKSTQELRKLKEFGVISEQEYKEKSERIINKKQDEFFLKSEEYKSLKRLKNNGILTQSEFEEKSELLKNKILNEVEESEEIEVLTKTPTRKKEFKIATGRIDKIEFRKKFIFFAILYIVLISTAFLPYKLSRLLSFPLGLCAFIYSIYLINPAAKRLQDLKINGLWSLLFIVPLFAFIIGIYLSAKDGNARNSVRY
jgi:hypothetical protein